MARPLRIQFPGGLYHVTARGNERRPVFADDTDRERFLAVMAAVVGRYHLLCHAYCLMGNHYHLLLETPEANLSCAMRQLNGVYSQAFNRRHRRSGHLFEGRFHALLVDRDSYLRVVCRYIVLNPVRAGLVDHPREWRWSSYRAAAGEAPVPPGLTVDWVLELGDTTVRHEAQHRYRQFVEAGRSETACPLESDGMGPLTGNVTPPAHVHPDAASLIEVPRAQRFAPRPPLEALFAEVASRAERDRRCAIAVRQHGYTLKAIARFLGLHYATVTRALARDDAKAAATPMSYFKT